MIDLRTGATRQVAGAEDVHQPHWSPNGHRIAYWGRLLATGHRDLWTVGSSGGDPIQVTADAPSDWNPVWSADGRHLYFSSDRGGSMNLWRVPIDESSGRVLGPPEAVTTPSPYSGYVSIARVGGRMAYSQLADSANIFKAAFDPSTGTATDPPTELTRGSRLYAVPDLSPDSRWVTFVLQGPSEDIFVARTDGSEPPRQLTADLHFHSNRSGKFEMWTINADGSGLRQVTEVQRAAAGPGVWSPDGRQVAFRGADHGDVRSRILVTDVDAPLAEQTPRVIFESPPGGNAFPSSWSADGRRLAIQQNLPASAAGIFVYDFDSQQARRLTGSGVSARWLSDSRRLLFIDRGRFHVADSDSGDIREGGTAPSAEVFSLSLDDRLIAHRVLVREADIWLADPQTPEPDGER